MAFSFALPICSSEPEPGCDVAAAAASRMFHKQVIEQKHDTFEASSVSFAPKSSLEGSISLAASPIQVFWQGLSATSHVTSDPYVAPSDMDQDQEVDKSSPAPSRDLAVSNTHLP